MAKQKQGQVDDILDVLVVGGGPGGTATAFRAIELGLSALVIDLDDLMRRIRDYAKDKLIEPGFGRGDRMKFPAGGDLIAKLRFDPIDKDDMCQLWKSFYAEHKVPAQVGVELTGLECNDNIWQAIAWNHIAKTEQTIYAKHVVLSLGRGVPRRFDIPGNLDGIAYQLTDAANYVGQPACIIGGGTSAAEAVIAISNAKRKNNDASHVYWSYRGESMPRVSKALADVFFEAYVGNGNVRYFPKSEPVAVVTGDDRNEYLSIRTDRKVIPGRPNETQNLEFLKEQCIACIGGETPERFLNSLGIYLVTGGPKDKKRIVVTPHLETRQPNVYLVGDVLSNIYFETTDFDADPKTFVEKKQAGNIKAALRDGVLVAEVIKAKLEGRTEIGTLVADAEEDAQEVTQVSSPVVPVPETGSDDDAEEQLELPARIVRILDGDVDESEYPLRKNGVTTIGRKGCDVNLEEDVHVADNHASIVHDGDDYFLRDDGGKTGVMFRVPVGREYELKSGGLVRIGRQFLLFGEHQGSRLVVHYDNTGKEKGRHRLSKDYLFIGRDLGHVNLDEKDMALSRRHLSAVVRDGSIFIEDLGSLNGTYVKVKQSVKLSDGDSFRVGQHLFRFTQQSEETGAGTIEQTKPSVISASDTEPVTKDKLLVLFKNENEQCTADLGATLLEIAEDNDIEIAFSCRMGVCGVDPVKVCAGHDNLEAMTDKEKKTLTKCKLEPGKYRLACMAKPKGRVEIETLG